MGSWKPTKNHALHDLQAVKVHPGVRRLAQQPQRKIPSPRVRLSPLTEQLRLSLQLPGGHRGRRREVKAQKHRPCVVFERGRHDDDFVRVMVMNDGGMERMGGRRRTWVDDEKRTLVRKTGKENE